MNFQCFVAGFPITSDFRHLKIQEVSIVAPNFGPPNQSKLHLFEKTHNATVHIGILTSRHAEYREHEVIYVYVK